MDLRDGRQVILEDCNPRYRGNDLPHKFLHVADKDASLHEPSEQKPRFGVDRLKLRFAPCEDAKVERLGLLQ